MSKVDIYARVIKLKNQLSQNEYGTQWTHSEKMAAHGALNTVLDMINEYSQ